MKKISFEPLLYAIVGYSLDWLVQNKMDIVKVKGILLGNVS